MAKSEEDHRADIAWHRGRAEKFRKDAASTTGDRRAYYMRHANQEEMAAINLEGRLAKGADGPCGNHQWRQSGKVLTGTMQPAAWKMVNHLWGQPDKAADFDDLKVPVYDDPEHLADANAFGSLRRAANSYFRDNKIPWSVAIKKTSVSLQLEK